MFLLEKKEKLPYETFEASYDLEYGTAVVEMHTDSLTSDDRVVIVDDLLATGGTAVAAVSLVDKFNAEIVAIDFVVELVSLNGRALLKKYPVHTVLAYD